MADEAVVMKQLWVGRKPFVLVEISRWTEEGYPVLDIQFGGGVEEANVPELLSMIGASMTAESEAGRG